MKKKITFLTCAKNDGYYENYIQRLEYVLNFNLSNIYLSGLEKFIEILYVDYGSSKSLSKSIKIYNNKHKKNITFLKISKKELRKRFKSKFITDFSPQVAHNLAAVHSNSDFIMWGASDIIFTLENLKNLKNFFSQKNYNFSKKIYYCKRKFLDEKFIDKKYHSFNQLNNFFDNYHFSKHQFGKNHAHTGGGPGCIIMKTNEFIKNQGLDENIDRLNWARNEVRFLHKINENYSTKDLSINGICVFKFNYTALGKRRYQFKKYKNNFSSSGKKLEKINIKELKKFFIVKEKPKLSSVKNQGDITSEKFLVNCTKDLPQENFYQKIYSLLKFSYNFSIINEKSFRNYLLIKKLIFVIKKTPTLSFNLISNNNLSFLPVIISNYFKFINIIYYDLKNEKNFEIWDKFKSNFNNSHIGQVQYLSNLSTISQILNFSNFQTKQSYSNILFIDSSNGPDLNFQKNFNSNIEKYSDRFSMIFLTNSKLFFNSKNKFKKIYFTKKFSIFLNKKINKNKVYNSLFKNYNNNFILNFLSYIFILYSGYLINFLKILSNLKFHIKKNIKKISIQ